MLDELEIAEERIEAMLKNLHEQTYILHTRYIVYGTMYPSWPDAIEALEQTINEIKTEVGITPPGTGSRRSRVCDNPATRLLRRNPRTACLLGGHGNQNPATDSRLGNDAEGPENCLGNPDDLNGA